MSESPLFWRLARTPSRAPKPDVSGYLLTTIPPELRAAVEAFDETRRTTCGNSAEPPMSDAAKLTIAPMIAAAVQAYVETIMRSAA